MILINRFQIISENQKYDELFIADEQNYEYKKVAIIKTIKVKKGFNMNDMNIEDTKKETTLIAESPDIQKNNVSEDAIVDKTNSESDSP